MAEGPVDEAGGGCRTENGADAKVKLMEVEKKVERGFKKGGYGTLVANHIIDLVNTKNLARGAAEIEELAETLDISDEDRQELRERWANLTTRVEKGVFGNEGTNEIVKLGLFPAIRESRLETLADVG